MYPVLHLGGMTFSMTGLGIVSFLIVFILIVKNRCARTGLRFREILRFLPMTIILAYLLGTRTRYVFSDFIIFPLEPVRRLWYLSPYEYHFHLVGVLLGLLIGWKKFLNSQPRETHLRRYSVVFEGILLATLPLGIFFLFGDHFLGKPIESGRYVSAIDPISKMAAYDKLIPLGIYLSAGAGIIYLLVAILYQWRPKQQWIFLGFILYRLMIGSLLLWQIYARHLVTKRLGMTFDIKQYMCIFMALLTVRAWIVHNSSSANESLHETHDTI